MARAETGMRSRKVVGLAMAMIMVICDMSYVWVKPRSATGRSRIMGETQSSVLIIWPNPRSVRGNHRLTSVTERFHCLRLLLA